MIETLTWQESLALNLRMMGMEIPTGLDVDIEAAREKNRRIIGQLYTNPIDVYLMVSLNGGDAKHFREAEELTHRIRDSLGVNVVSPISFAGETTEQKGDISRHICSNARCGYLEFKPASWGKYSEAADMLWQDKQVVSFLDEKELGLMPRHPRKMIGRYEDGRGMHLVTSYEKAVDCLRDILHNELQTRTERDPLPTNADYFVNTYCLSCESLIRRHQETKKPK